MRVDVMGVDAVWLPTDIDERELDSYIANDNYCIQKKEDGIHILAARKTDPDRVVTLNRRGEPHGIPAPLQKVLIQMAPDTMLDGEKLHEGGMVVFDMLYDAGKDLRVLTYGERMVAMLEWYEDFLMTTKTRLVRIVETALDPAGKRALVNRLRAENAEGVIIKDLRAPYTPGRTAWGWTMRRLKFLKSMTAMIMRRPADYKGKDADKASFELFLTEGGKWVNIGTVSAQQFYDRLKPGESAIAEVSYLYATPGNRVVQPRLKRPDPFRSDKQAEDCTLDQLIKGGRFAS